MSIEYDLSLQGGASAAISSEAAALATKIKDTIAIVQQGLIERDTEVCDVSVLAPQQQCTLARNKNDL